MGEAGHAQQTIRFGVFEVDLYSGELRKSGVRIKLQEQPFKVLTALLERPGEVVTRQELRRRIWPHESSGDFDHAVNIAVAKLRTALGDSAEAPHLIETLHRRGYRFIFPVSGNGSKEQVPSVVLRPPTENEAGTSEVEANAIIPDRGRPPDSIFGISARSRWSWGSVFGLILVVGGTIAWFIRPLAPPRVLSTTQVTHDGLTTTGVLTDGSRLYITESTGSKQFLVEASATGGESRVIPTPFANIVTSDISPDHSEMLVADAVGPQYEFPVWILPLPSGPPRRLADITARCDTWSSQGWATWSPDGRQIAFAKGSDIYLANADGSNVKKLITLSGYASEIRFSPDGTHLRFTLRHFQNNRSAWIFDVRTNGSDLHPLFPGWKSSFSHMAGDWSRDGRYYFFTFCEGPNNNCNIWTTHERHGFFSLQPSPPIQMTNGPMSVYFNGLSLDGRRIFAGGWTVKSEVVRYDPGLHQFVPFLGGISATELDFTRDGKWVAYVSHPEGSLWRSRVDGSERLQLTAPPVSALLPRWSPDGSQIAFVDEQAGPRWKIFLMPPQGGTPREMLAENQYQMDPNWSPDGKQLVFGRVPWLKGTGENIAIEIFDLDSKNVSTIPGSENLFAPRWSPDGRYLAALSGDGKNLLMYEFKTRKWRHWLSESGDIEQPEWSRDGKYIYYSNASTSNPSYRRVQVGQHRSEFLIDLKTLHRGGTDPAAAALGPWSSLAPDGAALFGRDLSSDEVYSLEVELP